MELSMALVRPDLVLQVALLVFLDNQPVLLPLRGRLRLEIVLVQDVPLSSEVLELLAVAFRELPKATNL